VLQESAGTSRIGMGADPNLSTNRVRDAFDRLAGKLVRTELKGIRDVVLAAQAVLSGRLDTNSLRDRDSITALALLHIEYLEALTDATWGFREEIERLLTTGPTRFSLTMDPVTVHLKGVSETLEGTFRVANRSNAKIDVELAHGAVVGPMPDSTIDDIIIEFQPSRFEVPSGDSVAVYVRVLLATDLPEGDYQTRIINLRTPGWPGLLLIHREESDAESKITKRKRSPATAKPASRLSESAKSGSRPKRRSDSDRPTNGPQRIHLDTCTPAELANAVRGVNLPLAREIVATRERQGGTLSPDELRQVRGVGPKLAERIVRQLNQT
jgi:hypothetical protein